MNQPNYCRTSSAHTGRSACIANWYQAPHLRKAPFRIETARMQSYDPDPSSLMAASGGAEAFNAPRVSACVAAVDEYVKRSSDAHRGVLVAITAWSGWGKTRALRSLCGALPNAILFGLSHEGAVGWAAVAELAEAADTGASLLIDDPSYNLSVEKALDPVWRIVQARRGAMVITALSADAVNRMVSSVPDIVVHLGDGRNGRQLQPPPLEQRG